MLVAERRQAGRNRDDCGSVCRSPNVHTLDEAIVKVREAAGRQAHQSVASVDHKEHTLT
jgi:hypothetical protein